MTRSKDLGIAGELFMRDYLSRLALLMTLLAAAGCRIPVGPWGGPGYELHTDKIGTGEQAIQPRNDSTYWHGERMDQRTR
jgi:hypothetical protein